MADNIFHCQVEFDFYVIAENREEAKERADTCAKDEFDDNIRHQPSAFISEVNSPRNVLSEWLDAIPWGGEDDKTIRQIFEERRIEMGPQPLPNQTHLFSKQRKRQRSFRHKRIEYRANYKQVLSNRYIRVYQGDGMGRKCR